VPRLEKRRKHLYDTYVSPVVADIATVNSR